MEKEALKITGKDPVKDVEYWNNFLFKKIEQLQNQSRIKGYTIWILLAALAIVINRIFIFWKDYGLPQNLIQFSLTWILITCFILLFSFIYSILSNKIQPNISYDNLPILTGQLPFEALFLLTIVFLSLFFAVRYCIFSIEKLFIFQAISYSLWFANILFFILTITGLLLLFNWLKFPFISATDKKGNFDKALIFLFLFLGNLFLTIVIYTYIFFSYKFYSLSNFSNCLYFVILLWTIIILIYLFSKTRSPLVLIEKLSELQDRIVTGGIEDAKKIAEKYSSITTGEKLSSWGRSFWLDFQRKIEAGKNMMLIIEKQIEQLAALEKNPSDCNADELKKLHEDMITNFNIAKKQIDQIGKVSVKFYSFMQLYRNNIEIVEALSQGQKEAFNELLQYKELSLRIEILSRKTPRTNIISQI